MATKIKQKLKEYLNSLFRRPRQSVRQESIESKKRLIDEIRREAKKRKSARKRRKQECHPELDSGSKEIPDQVRNDTPLPHPQTQAQTSQAPAQLPETHRGTDRNFPNIFQNQLLLPILDSHHQRLRQSSDSSHQLPFLPGPNLRRQSGRSDPEDQIQTDFLLLLRSQKISEKIKDLHFQRSGSGFNRNHYCFSFPSHVPETFFGGVI